MEACVFTSTVLILVNESPTKDFKVGSVLRNGDPLSSFSFVIAVKGLTGLFKKVVEVGDFKVNEEVKYDIL